MEVKNGTALKFFWLISQLTDSETGEKITLRGEEVIPYLLPAFESHLRSQGWLHKTYFHIQDEPSLHNACRWREISSYLHQYAPDLRRMDAIETTYLLDEIEVAVPKLDALASWYDIYKTWEQEGNELWFYTVGIYQASLLPNKTIDMPVMDSRILHWLNYKYDATGYLHWGWNQWTDKSICGSRYSYRRWLACLSGQGWGFEFFALGTDAEWNTGLRIFLDAGR